MARLILVTTLLLTAVSFCQSRSRISVLALHAEVAAATTLSAEQPKLQDGTSRVFVENISNDRLRITVVLQGTGSASRVQLPVSLRTNLRSCLLKVVQVEGSVPATVFALTPEGQLTSGIHGVRNDATFAMIAPRRMNEPDRRTLNLTFEPFPRGQEAQVRLQIQAIAQ